MALSSRPKTLRSLRTRTGKPAPRPVRAGRATTADPITAAEAYDLIHYLRDMQRKNPQ